MCSFKRLFLIISMLVFAGTVFGLADEEAAKMFSATPEKGPVKTKAPRKLLVFSLTKGFRHGSIPKWNKALSIMGDKTGAFTVVHSKDMNVFNAEDLKQFDAICFNNTTKLIPNEAQQKAIMDFIKGGKGIVGIHAATDNFYEWPEGNMMMGGVFTGHPWRAAGTVKIKIDDPTHPLTKMFAGKGFKIRDEIYRTAPPQYSRNNQRVLMSLDMSDENTKSKASKPTDSDTGITWIKSVGKGRLFYCSLGHNNDLTWNPLVLEHYLAGIQFAMGDLEADTTTIPLVAESASIKGMLESIKDFEYGKSRKGLIAVEKAISDASGKSEKLQHIAADLLEFLANPKNATAASKQFVCIQLGLIGSERSVDILAKMLPDKDTSDIARYALERIKGQAADHALMSALDETSSDVKVGIITSIAARKISAAVIPLSELARSFDKKLAIASISALGIIGTEDAADALESSLNKVNGSLRPLVENALIDCADSIAANGNQSKAYSIYKTLNESASTDPVKGAAVAGMVNTNNSLAADIIISSIKSPNGFVRSQAISLISEVEGDTDIKKIFSISSQLSTADKIHLLTEAGNINSPVSLELANKYISDTDSTIRIAAIHTIGKVGSVDSVKPLLEIASSATSSEKYASRQSLYSLKRSDVDKEIVKLLGETQNLMVRTELVIAVGQRRITGTTDILAKMTRSSDTVLSREAFKSLGIVASKDDFPKVIELLLDLKSESVRSDAEKSVLSVMVATKSDLSPLISACKSQKDSKAIASMMFLLGKTADPDALKILLDGLENSDETIKATAIRALSDWSDGKVAKDLLDVSVKSDNKIHKVLAFRGFVASIPKKSNRSIDENIELFSKAMDLATNLPEKRLVLSTLQKLPHARTLEMASSYLDDTELKEEACSATYAIAEVTAKGDKALKEQTKAALQKVLKISNNKSIVRRSDGLIKKLSL